MDIADLPLGERLVFRDDLFDVENCLAVVRRFEVLAQRFAAHGDAFEHDFGLAQRQRVAFDRVGVIGPFQRQLFAQRRKRVSWQRTRRIQLCLVGVDSFQQDF